MTTALTATGKPQAPSIPSQPSLATPQDQTTQKTEVLARQTVSTSSSSANRLPPPVPQYPPNTAPANPNTQLQRLGFYFTVGVKYTYEESAKPQNITSTFFTYKISLYKGEFIDYKSVATTTKDPKTGKDVLSRLTYQTLDEAVETTKRIAKKFGKHFVPMGTRVYFIFSPKNGKNNITAIYFNQGKLSQETVNDTNNTALSCLFPKTEKSVLDTITGSFIACTTHLNHKRHGTEAAAIFLNLNNKTQLCIKLSSHHPHLITAENLEALAQKTATTSSEKKENK